MDHESAKGRKRERGLGMRAVILAIWFVAFGCGFATAQELVGGPLVLEIWPGRAPGDVGEFGPEIVRMSPKRERKISEATEPSKLITSVTKPSISVWRPAKEIDTGTAMVIFPGGGYWDLYWEVEGEEVAKWLTS